jgi:hypothetical protein
VGDDLVQVAMLGVQFEQLVAEVRRFGVAHRLSGHGVFLEGCDVLLEYPERFWGRRGK